MARSDINVGRKKIGKPKKRRVATSTLNARWCRYAPNNAPVNVGLPILMTLGAMTYGQKRFYSKTFHDLSEGFVQ